MNLSFHTASSEATTARALQVHLKHATSSALILFSTTLSSPSGSSQSPCPSACASIGKKRRSHTTVTSRLVEECWCFVLRACVTVALTYFVDQLRYMVYMGTCSGSSFRNGGTAVDEKV